MDKRAIGVFDSGLGGLTVLKEIEKQLPNENIIYFGDTARVPYGSKTKEQVLLYTKKIVEFLISKNVKAIVIACNTATASALDEIRGCYDLPIIGVIEPGARAVNKMSNEKKVLVLGTEGTIKSNAYEKELNKLDDRFEVIGKACPLFVHIVENGFVNTKKSQSIVTGELLKFKNLGIDSVVLGCTHYPYLENEIGEAMGKDVVLVNPAIETVVDLKNTLKENNILNKLNAQGMKTFYVSGDKNSFIDNAKVFMREEIKVLKGYLEI